MLRLCQFVSRDGLAETKRSRMLSFRETGTHVIKIRNVKGDMANFNFQNVFIHIVINV